MGLNNPPCALASVAPLASLADALTQRGHEARLIAAASFVAVRTPHGPGPFERIYLCDGHFRWARTPARGRDIARHDDVPRAADTIAGALARELNTHEVVTPASTTSSRIYPPGGPAAEPGTP